MELRQRVRSRRWLVALVAWFVLIGAFALLMVSATRTDPTPFGYGYGDYAYCGTDLLESDDGTTIDGCLLPARAVSGFTVSPSVPAGWEVDDASAVCAANADGVVECWVAQWWTRNRTVCFDDRSAPVCFRDDTAVPNEAPVPQLSFTCPNTDDGSAVCTVPGDMFHGVVHSPSMTCTIHPDNTGTCTWAPIDGWTPSAGPLVFGAVVLFVLGLGLLVTPALTAGSINGDRAAGTLATLQVTPLSATAIALGKLLAAWGTMLAFVLAASPWLAVGVVIGGISPLQVLGCCALLMLELAVMCAVGLGWSALVNRTSGSNLLSYLTVVTLSVLTIVFLALLTPFTERDTDVEVLRLPDDVNARWEAESSAYYENPDATGPPPVPDGPCVWHTETWYQHHTNEVWWILAPNPFVMVADAAPEPRVAKTHPRVYADWGNDPLFAIRGTIAELATPPAAQVDECYVAGDRTPVVDEPTRVRVWPWSLAANLLLGGGFFAIAVRRLMVPYRKLPKGTRVA